MARELTQMCYVHQVKRRGGSGVFQHKEVVTQMDLLWYQEAGGWPTTSHTLTGSGSQLSQGLCLIVELSERAGEEVSLPSLNKQVVEEEDPHPAITQQTMTKSQLRQT
ncbi:hypothetical protein MHYP_G00196940 [Metynnis hypsauchen]